MTPTHPTRTLKALLTSAMGILIVATVALLVWRSANFRETAAHAQDLHLRSVYLATEIIGNLALARLSIIEPGRQRLSPTGHLSLAERDLAQLKTLDEGFEHGRWRYLLDALDTDLYAVGDEMSSGRMIAETTDAAAITAEQIKRAHRIEYEEHVDRLLAASHTDRRLLVTFALSVLLGTFLVANWLINRLAEADRARLKVIADLKQKNEELTRFSYAVSHDLKSPLITIGGFADLLDSDLANADLQSARNDARRIHSGIQRMQRLLDDLLALSVAGKIVARRRPVAMTKLVNDVLASVRESGAAGQVRFETTGELPVVRVDRDRLFDALTNIVENAIKFMGEQSDPLVRVGQEDAPEGPVFFASDNGSGIAPDDLDRVFVLFERLNAEAKGTGIGLALARRIIEAHGGRIWVESAGPGHGSTFYFTLGP